MNEQLVAEALERRAEDVQPRHLGFEEVRARAHGIRRRRRTVAAGAAAAVVAAVLIVPGLVGGTPRSSGPEPAPPSPVDRVVFLRDGQVHLPGGRTVGVDLDTRDVLQLGVLDDGRIVVATSRPRAVQVFSPDGDRQAVHRVAVNTITMSADDHLVAWTDDSFTVQVLEGGVAEPVALSGIPLPGESFPTLDGVVGARCGEGGCTVWGGDGTTTSAAATTEGPLELATAEPLRISDVSADGDQWAVSFPAADGEQYGCSGLYDVEADRVTDRGCATSGLRFAPDGEHLLGMRGDNQVYGEVEVYDRRLRQVLVYDPEGRRVVKSASWADDTHLLVVTADLSEDPAWQLLRVPVDGGAPETVVGPVDGPDAEAGSAFVLAE